jgi:hypothetical protein
MTYKLSNVLKLPSIRIKTCNVVGMPIGVILKLTQVIFLVWMTVLAPFCLFDLGW